MYNQSGKFFRLFATIFFSVVGFVLAIGLLMLLLRLIVSSFDQIPWFTYFYMCIIILLTPCLFITVYSIFLKKTVYHPSKPVKMISYLVFTMAILSWLTVLTIDFIEFFKNGYPDIDRYYGYNLLFLFINVAIIFFSGVMQALTTEKEKDWMEKRRN